MARSTVEADRRHSWRVGRFLCALAATMAVMAAVPAFASAQAGISAARLDPSQAAPPGSVLVDTRIYVTSSGAAPLAVSYSFTDETPGSSNCRAVNLFQQGPEYRTGLFNLTLPRPGGARRLYVRAWTNANCTAGASVVTSIPVDVTVPGANPVLLQRCGLDVILVLDESASISSFGAVETVRSAATSFVNALFGTGSRVATVAFSRAARIGVPYDFVNAGSRGNFISWINGQSFNGSPGYAPSSATQHLGTNWQGGFEAVKELNRSRRADLVVFVTDGDPNWHDNRSSALSPDGHYQAMQRAWAAANEVKLQSSRVFAIGVGPAVTGANSADSAARLTAVSGNTKFVLGTPDTDLDETDELPRADYTLVTEFEALAERLESIVRAVCSPSVTITKWVSPTGAPGSFVKGGPGWQFTGNLTVAPPGHEWLTPPAEPGDAPVVPAETDNYGLAAFQWQITDDDARSTLRVQETAKENYSFLSAECLVRAAGEEPAVIPGLTVALGADDFATCDVFNQGPTGTLTVNKELIPSTDPGLFDLLVNDHEKAQQVGDGEGTGPLTLPAGEHLVREEISDVLRPDFSLDQYEISTSCVSGGTQVASGTGSAAVPVPLPPGANVTCTITNRRIDQPEPEPAPEPAPEPMVPPPPCSDFTQPPAGCAGTDPPPVVPETVLAIRKRMRARARVGSRVPIRITVRNVGQHTATGVTLQETPPGGLRIVRVARRNVTRHRGGAVTWRLGNIAPGARRTVRATMLVARRGSLRNWALTSANNAGVVAARATVRARARAAPRRPPPPAVTG
jgi:uncharacterized repeat protein (TIGR01451 family)